MISQKTLQTASLLLQIHAATNKPKQKQYKPIQLKQPVRVIRTRQWKQVYHWFVEDNFQTSNV